jgi:hypothetical protein
MTRHLMLAAGILIFSTTVRAEERDLSTFAWLAGAWEFTEGTAATEERWTSPTANVILGVSRSVKDGRTVNFEFMRLEKRGADIYYIPQPAGRPPVDFKLTSSEGGRYIFENTEGVDRVHRIEYRREGDDGLYARLDGVQNGKPFLLEYRYRRKL